MLTYTEENYLKTLFKIGVEEEIREVGTNELAEYLSIKPATANHMLKKLKSKFLVEYEKYGKITMTESGKKYAIEVIRKHRLWETFLYEKLEFKWDEVHDVAEQLEHIQSTKLIDKLDKFLNFPQYDPHGDPIPNHLGEIKIQMKKSLSQVEMGKTCQLIGVRDVSGSFLKSVFDLGLGLNDQIKLVSKHAFDGTLVIEVKNIQSVVSQKFADNMYVL